MALYLYGSATDVRAELGNPDETEYTASDITRARTSATNIVNAYIQKAYPSQVPYTSATEPEIVKTITNDLAVYFARRSKHPGPAPLSETLRQEYYERNIELLKGIAEGEVEIPEMEDALGDSVLTSREGHPIFDVDEIEKHIIDDDTLEEIDDSRD